MSFLIFWLPIIGGILLGGFAAAALYSERYTQGLWLGFFGVICFLLLGAIQIQKYISAASEPAIPPAVALDQRPWVSVTIEPAGPITWNDGGFQVSYKITLKNTGKSPALKVSHVETIILERDADLAGQQTILSKMLLASGPFFGVANIMPGDNRQLIINQQVDRQHVEKAAVPWTDAGGPKLISPVLVGVADYTTEFDAVIRHTGFIYEIGFWDPKKGIIVTALAPTEDGDIPAERVRILRHPRVDGQVD